ncbi:MAG: sugar transferase [Clostridiales bacterium]|nr:sugar transferase [Clostridiales bacterium]
MFYQQAGKRVLDVLGAGIGLVLCSPVLLVTAIVVKRNLGSPVLFCQERPGKNGKIFRMVKFRTMTDEKDETGNLLPDDLRLGKTGKFLRSTSLDELPELWNVLKGDMSFVGPRPLLVRYLPRYTKRQSRRHEVRPGITGYAQAYGRNAISWEEKFEKDVYYVDHLSFWLDVKILCKTVQTVLSREGVHSEGSLTMEEFMGSQEGDGEECRNSLL